jgi:hypothetical protein
VRATAALLRRRVAAQPLWLPVHGMSMQPSILDGSEVQLVPASRPRRGELWAFCSAAGDLVVHRCRRFENGAYVFAGDAQLIADAPVRDEQLIGRVVALRSAGATRTLTARDRLVWRAKNACRTVGVRRKRRSDDDVGAEDDELTLE